MTRLSKIAVLALGLTAPALAGAQEISHKQADNFANWLVVDGQHAKAAGLYADAFKEKATNSYGYQAAELYFYVKDYAKAAEFYKAVLQATTSYPDAPLKYARSLKRMGQYVEAREAFTRYRKAYTGTDTAAVRARIDQEVQGIDLAEKEMTRVDPTVFVDKLGGSINSMKNEIAPMLVGNSIVFVSDFDGTMRAYSSTKGREGWSQMRPAPELPVLDNGVGHIGGGTLVTPDRYVFSLCAQAQHMAQPAVACQIVQSIRRGGAWGAPKPVTGPINAEGSTAAQPFIFTEGDTEIMIFASDRPNGQGGMDLWRAERSTATEGSPWGAPVNLGPQVNTAGNEVTPFFNTETRVLSYATDGGVTLGGYDIVHATAKDGGLASWGPRKNPGTPINSGGDDYHYVEVVGKSRAYLSSNRSEDLAKTALSNEDIFVVTYDNPNITTELSILDDVTGLPISDPTITVKLNPDGLQRKPLLAQRSLNGTYSLMLPVDRDIKIEIERPYCEGATVDLVIPVGERDGYAIPAVRLRRAEVGEGQVPVVAGLRDAGGATPAKADVMTANGQEDDN